MLKNTIELLITGKKLGNGTQQLISLLFLFRIPGNYIYLLDEPENGLHPGLQTLLLQFVKNEILNVKKYSKQFFFATHSTSFIDFKGECSVYSCLKTKETFRLKKLSKENFEEIRDFLGITPGYALQKNGIIWVEGPSDAIYIKAYLKCFDIDTEEEDIIILHYNGKTFLKKKHISLKLMKAINLNFLVLVDSDYDKPNMSLDRGLKRIKDKFEKENYTFFIIERVRDIEGLIPQEILNQYFKIKTPLEKENLKNSYEKLGDYIKRIKDLHLTELNSPRFDKIKTAKGIKRLLEEDISLHHHIIDNPCIKEIVNILANNFTRWIPNPISKNLQNKNYKNNKDFQEDVIELIENSRFGSREYTPYEIFIKTLYEFQKEELKEEVKYEKTGLPNTKVNLAEFQEDAIARIWSRLKKYNGCIIADSVSLGKTGIAIKILEKIGYYERKNILIICPAQLRDIWRKALKSIDVKENILSQEELSTTNFLDKALDALGGRTEDVELIVIDESHNFRNRLTNRWENLFTLINDHIIKGDKRPNMLFLTATPIINTPWDLYWQIMLLVLGDNSAFIKRNIVDLFSFFKKASLNPAMLNDLLNEISIRRTRDYIVKNYPDAYILVPNSEGVLEEKKIIFPERVLENINYYLDKAYEGMYRQIADTITTKLTIVYYKILEYKIEGILTEKEQSGLGRMIGIGYFYKTTLLKRLESSVEAFRISVERHITFLEKLKESLNKDKLLTKKYFHKYFLSIDEELDLEELKVELKDFEAKQYRTKDLLKDIDLDVKYLKEILDKMKKIDPEKDTKLAALKKKLLELSQKAQIVVFTCYMDTLNYIYREILKDVRFAHLRIEAISSSAETNKTPSQRTKIIDDFFAKKIDIILCTDMLSEGLNLQTAKYLVNYDLHWNPTRMIQRAGRIDRIGSPFKKIFIYNFFPEDKFEDLLRLVQILQEKIAAIDNSVGFDQTVLGEVIQSNVFGIIRRIKEKDSEVLNELEMDAYGGGEIFYQPLKDFIKTSSIEKLEIIPYSIYSGLKKGKNLLGIFFYYQYGNDFHFWYLYDVKNENILTNKTEILDYIQCNREEQRIIPNFLKKLSEINKKILERLERDYKEIELSQAKDSKLKPFDRSKLKLITIDFIS